MPAPQGPCVSACLTSLPGLWNAGLTHGLWRGLLVMRPETPPVDPGPPALRRLPWPVLWRSRADIAHEFSSLLYMLQAVFKNHLSLIYSGKLFFIQISSFLLPLLSMFFPCIDWIFSHISASYKKRHPQRFPPTWGGQGLLPLGSRRRELQVQPSWMLTDTWIGFFVLLCFYVKYCLQFWYRKSCFLQEEQMYSVSDIF